MHRRWDEIAPRRQRVEAFKLLQWNVLADGLAQSGDFVRAPKDKDILSWPFRAPLILAEIDRSDADVVCLEEVNHYDEIAAELSSRGYSGVFAEKPSSPCETMGYARDGTAVFWRSSRFEPAAGAEPSRNVYIDGDGKNLNQTWVAQLLRDRGTGAEILVAATHLKAKGDEKSAAMRLLQAAQLKQHLSRLVPLAADTGRALVVAGDFNDTPESPCIEAMLADTHPRLLSTHSEADGAFTTWKFRSRRDGGGETEIRRVIDYILYSPGEGGAALRPVARWADPTSDEIGPGGLPSVEYPSDHLAQLVEFEWGGIVE